MGLEAWLADTVSAAGYDGTVVDSSQGLAIRQGAEGQRDPHVWHDPRNAQAMVRTITAALVAQDADGRAAYEANAAAYTAKLAALDRATRAKIDSIPPRLRKLVTDHDAFGYYCARYGLTFVGSVIPSFDTSAELSGRQLSDLVAKIRATGVRAVFSEASLPPRTAETVAREAGVEVVGGEGALYADGLGPAGLARRHLPPRRAAQHRHDREGARWPRLSCCASSRPAWRTAGSGWSSRSTAPSGPARRSP